MDEQKNRDEEELRAGLADMVRSDGPLRHRAGIGARLRTYFLTGLVVAAPVGVTAFLTWWFVGLFDGWIKPLIPARYSPDTYLPFTVPGFGLVVALICITLLGALTANLFGRTVVSWGERLLNRMPVIRNIYRAVKQIFETAISQSNSSFREVGLIQYPRKGLYAIVFIARESSKRITDAAGAGEMLTVFLPTTPNPTSGFLLFVPRKELIVLDMTVEDAAKLVISAGLVTPESNTELGHVPVLPESEARRLVRREQASTGKEAAE